MKKLNEILSYIQFPEKYFNLNLKKSINYKSDYQGIIELKKLNLNEEFIKRIIYRRREKEEFWNSIDIYIQPLKIDEFLKNLFLEETIDFKSMENNENIFKLKIDSLTRLEITKIDNQIVIQITKFENNNFA